ncbi:MAG: SEC-C domain-containing protein [Rhodoferax sp.]|nr:SEC-C domain-containing protein [Rhodoferax sp.]
MNQSGEWDDSDSNQGPVSEEEWSNFLAICGGLVYQGTTADKFLDWAATSGHYVLPGMAAATANPTDVPKLLRSLAVQVWNQFPIPGHQWQPQPLKRPGRNEPCWCGSGQKFKHCCESLAARKFPRLNMLRFVLDACPATRLADLAKNGYPALDAVADTAHQWCEEGQSKRAVALLEPFFTAPKPLGARMEFLFDELMSALMEEGRNKRREHWIAEVLVRGDNALKSTALQRRATMRSDQGRAAEAWADFVQAQRINPNDPALSMLEVTLLMAENQMTRAAERAGWWAQHLGKLRDPAYADLVADLQAFAREPNGAMFGIARDLIPGVDRLAGLLRQAPPASPMHMLHIDRYASEPDEAGMAPMAQVEPLAALQVLEAQWCALFEQAKPSLVAVQNGSAEVWIKADAWLDLLQREPALWNSFEVLDDLVMAADALEITAVVEILLVPLAERAAELLRLLLEAQTAPVRVPWVMRDNRPVLRPIAHLVYVCKADGKWDRFMELARWLVLELNPNDNHGLRWDLSYALMLHERDQDALALDQFFPDEASPTLDLNRVLAHFRLGDLAQAQVDLRQAKLDHPKVVAMLLKPNPKPVKPDAWGVAVGGAFEAWLYVEPHRPLWEQSGAVAWAALALKK